ncbi:MAG: alpha/beta hydrolase [Allobranchiibius sp.]|nr:alpha/beta hydrolase [Actinomycetota bacterium]
MSTSHFALRTVTTTDGARLAAYIREPAGASSATTVVLSHGWTLAHQSWDQVARLLPDEIRVVTYDQRGHGTSTFSGGADRPQRESVRRLGSDLAEVISSCVPDDSPLVLGGHSMGGMSVMAFAGAHPYYFADRVQRVLLASTAISNLNGVKVRGAKTAMRILAHTPGRLGRAVTPKNQATLYGEHPDPALLEASRAVTSRTSLRAFGSFYGALMMHDETAAAATLAKVPVVVVVGTRDRLTSTRLGTVLAEAIPGAELRVVEGVGHMTPYEVPQLLATILRGGPESG